MSDAEARAIADEEAMQAALAKAYQRAERDGLITPDQIETLDNGVQVLPYINLIEEDFQ